MACSFPAMSTLDSMQGRRLSSDAAITTGDNAGSSTLGLKSQNLSKVGPNIDSVTITELHRHVVRESKMALSRQQLEMVDPII